MYISCTYNACIVQSESECTFAIQYAESSVMVSNDGSLSRQISIIVKTDYNR